MSDALADKLVPIREEETLSLLRNGGFKVDANEVKGLFSDFAEELHDAVLASELMWLVEKQVVARRARQEQGEIPSPILEEIYERQEKLREMGVDSEKIVILLRKIAELTSR